MVEKRKGFKSGAAFSIGTGHGRGTTSVVCVAVQLRMLRGRAADSEGKKAFDHIDGSAEAAAGRADANAPVFTGGSQDPLLLLPPGTRCVEGALTLART